MAGITNLTADSKLITPETSISNNTLVVSYNSQSNGSKRILSATKTYQAAFLCVETTRRIGFLKNGTFTAIGSYYLTDDVTYVISLYVTSTYFKLYINSVFVGQVSHGFSESELTLNFIGNGGGRTFSEDLAFSESLTFEDSSGMPCNGTLYSLEVFEGELTDSEQRGIVAMQKPTQPYSYADYLFDSAASDGLITPAEKRTYLSDWLTIYYLDQCTTELPIPVGSITYSGEYRSVAVASNAAGTWYTPEAYTYRTAVNNYRRILFDSSISGFLLTSKLGQTTDISALNPSLTNARNAIKSAIITLQSAIGGAQATTAQNNASVYALAQAELARVTAEAYADGIVSDEEARAIADAQAKADAAKAAALAEAPIYLGKFLDSAPTPIHVNDTYARYSATPGASNRGVFKWSGTAWVRTEARADIMQAGSDIGYIIAYKNTASPPVAIYGTAADYTSDSTVQADFAFFQAAFIGFLEAESIKIRNKLYSGVGNYGNPDTPLYIGADGSVFLYNALMKLVGQRFIHNAPDLPYLETVTTEISATEHSVSSASGTTTIYPTGIIIQDEDDNVSTLNRERCIAKNFYSYADIIGTNWQTILSTEGLSGSEIFEISGSVKMSISSGVTTFVGIISMMESLQITITTVQGNTAVWDQSLVLHVSEPQSSGYPWTLEVKTPYIWYPSRPDEPGDDSVWIQLRCIGKSV